jgi:pyrroline-5-carboxylate reductase
MPVEHPWPLAIGFLGAGQMATALALAWTRAGLLDVPNSRAADPHPDARAKFEQTTRVRAEATSAAVAAACDILVLAVKPHIVPAVLTELQPFVEPRHLIVSIAAGVTLAALGEQLGGAARIVRVMPNTPCLVGASATGYSTPTGLSHDPDAVLVGRLFAAVGQVYQLPEQLLDAVTGLSGSGPAFVYLFIEALADGGVKCGLPRAVAQALAAQTVLGAAKMVLETGQHPAALKDAVASPGGTTIAGLHALERASFRGAVMDAVEAAAARARELGNRD